MGKQYSRVLTIAGSDSGGGAGIQADIKAISACGGFATSAITVITVQNTVGVSGLYPLPVEAVEAQVRAVMEDIGSDAVKIGMLGSVELARTVAELLRLYKACNVVLDPVLIATSGDRLTTEETVSVILNDLVPLARVVTPNIMEAEALSGVKIHTVADYPKVWKVLKERGSKALLIKGGHASSDDGMLEDVLFTLDQGEHHFRNPRIETLNTHGTGCTLSSAMATFLARGYTLPEATEKAIDYLHRAIELGAKYTIGHGHGAVNHFYL